MNLPISQYDRLNTQHLSLPAIIEGLDRELISLNPLPGKWSIKDNIAHLTRYQLLFLKRLHTILTTEQPEFESYDADKDPEFVNWQQKGLSTLLTQLNSDRKKIIDLLEGMSEIDLQRVGLHAKFGQLTILDWTEFFLLHEAHHLFTIFKLAHHPD